MGERDRSRWPTGRGRNPGFLSRAQDLTLKMKIRRSLVRTTKSTQGKFYRHEITLPAELVEALGWTFGTELEARKVRDSIVLRKKR